MPWEGWWQVPQLRPFVPRERKKASPVPGSVETRPASLWKPMLPAGSGLVPFAGTVAGRPGRDAAGPRPTSAGGSAPRAERNVGPRYGGACAGTGGVSPARAPDGRAAGPSRHAAITTRRAARLLRVPPCLERCTRFLSPPAWLRHVCPEVTNRQKPDRPSAAMSEAGAQPRRACLSVLNPHAAPPDRAPVPARSGAPTSGGRRQPTWRMLATDGTPAPSRMNSM